MTIKLILCVILFAGYGYITDRYWSSTQIERTEASMGQLDEYGKNSGSEEQQKMLQDQNANTR